MAGQLGYYAAELGVGLASFGAGAAVENMIDRPGEIDPKTGEPRGMSVVGVLAGALLAGTTFTLGTLLVNKYMLDGFDDLFPKALP